MFSLSSAALDRPVGILHDITSLGDIYVPDPELDPELAARWLGEVVRMTGAWRARAACGAGIFGYPETGQKSRRCLSCERHVSSYEPPILIRIMPPISEDGLSVNYWNAYGLFALFA